MKVKRARTHWRERAYSFGLSPAAPTSPDFNGDGLVDGRDIDALTGEIVAGTHTPSYDLTGDKIVDLDDRDAWLAAAGAINLPSGNAYLLGDANLDGKVDVSDWNVLNSHMFTKVAGYCFGDFNADKVVDVSDLNILRESMFTRSDLRDGDVFTPVTLSVEVEMTAFEGETARRHTRSTVPPVRVSCVLFRTSSGWTRCTRNWSKLCGQPSGRPDASEGFPGSAQGTFPVPEERPSADSVEFELAEVLLAMRAASRIAKRRFNPLSAFTDGGHSPSLGAGPPCREHDSCCARRDRWRPS